MKDLEETIMQCVSTKESKRGADTGKASAPQSQGEHARRSSKAFVPDDVIPAPVWGGYEGRLGRTPPLWHPMPSLF